MNEQEFAQRLYEVSRDLNAIVMKHIAVNKSMGVKLGDPESGWSNEKQKMDIVAGEFYQECRDAFSKVQKFG